MELEIGRLYRAVRRLWWLPIVSALIFGLIGGIGSNVASNNYTATTRLIMLPEDATGGSIVGSVNMYIELVNLDSFLDQVIDELGLDMTADQLREKVVVVQQSGTLFLLVSVTDENPERAAEISTTIAESLESRVLDVTLSELQARELELEFRSNELQGRLTSVNARIDQLLESKNETESQRDAELAILRQESLEIAQQKSDIDVSLRDVRATLGSTTSELSILESATVPGNPDGLPMSLVAIIGAFVGGIIGCGLVLISAVRDDSVVNSAQVSRITGVPVLREISPTTLEKELSIVIRFVGSMRSDKAEDQQLIRIVAPTELAILNKVILDGNELQDVTLPLEPIMFANGAMTDQKVFMDAMSSAGVVLASRVGKTKESDLRTTVDSLHIANVPVIGNIVFKER